MRESAFPSPLGEITVGVTVTKPSVRSIVTAACPVATRPSSATLATYLIGYDETRSAMRTFRADRIVNPRITPSTFVRPKDVELERTLAAAWDIVADQPLEEIVVRFTPEAAPLASETRWHPSQSIEEQADLVMLLHEFTERTEVDGSVKHHQLHIAKQRNGKRDVKIPITYLAWKTLFRPKKNDGSTDMESN